MLMIAIILLIACNNTETLFIQNVNGVARGKNTDDGYNIYMIKSTHTLKKRDVYSIDTVSVPAGVPPKEETLIIIPNSGVNNYPYGSNNYPTNPALPAQRYGANTGTTVIVSNPNGNYNSGYGSRYYPNKYTSKYG